MANIGSEKCSFGELLNILPKIRTMTDLCYLNELSCQGFSRKWIKLLFYVAYNASSLNLPFNKAIQELQLFIYMITSANQLPTLFKTFESERTVEIIISHFKVFTQYISQQSFYNKYENIPLLLAILQLIPRIKEMGHQMQCETKNMLDALRTFYVVLKENVLKYEQLNRHVYTFHLNILSMLFEEHLKEKKGEKEEDDEAKTEDGKSDSFNEIIVDGNVLEDKEIINQNQSVNKSIQSIVNSVCNQEPISRQSQKELISNPVTSSISQDKEKLRRKRNEPFPYIPTVKVSENINLINLEKICKEQYILHKKHAKFYSNDFYKDDTYIMTRIGSTTFGLNKTPYSEDFLIQPRNSTVKQIVFKEMIDWLHQKKIDDQVFFYDTTHMPKYQKGIAYFTSQHIQGTSSVAIYLYNGGYELVNTFFQNFFAKNSVFSQLYVFCSDILKLESGIHLSLLIHGFFVAHFKLYQNTGRDFDFQFYAQGMSNVYATKRRVLFYYESFSSAYKEMSEWNMSRLITTFLNFYVSFSNKKDVVLALTKNNYLFRLDSTLKRLENSKDNAYWKKIGSFNEMLLKDSFTSYPDMLNFIDSD